MRKLQTAGGHQRRRRRAAHANSAAGLRLLLYIGRFREPRHPDVGLELLRKLKASRHTITGFIAVANDPLFAEATSLGIPVFPLLHELDLPAAAVKRLLHEDRPFQRKLAGWLGRLAAVKPEIGVVFGGGWIPPGLSHLPPRGFINYHLGPLPELRGFESDTFAVLEGRAKIWGTVHAVSDGYDEGPIILRGAQVRLQRYTTPVVVLHALFDRGVHAIVKALDMLSSNRAPLRAQDHRRATDATRARARRESVIRWGSDDAGLLQRRLLAFCGQNFPIRLKADLEGNRYCVRDLEVYRGQFPGRPGDLIGRYRGKGPWEGRPIVRTIDGAVVLEPGTRITPGMESPEEPLHRLIPPRRRRRGTTLRGLRASLEQETPRLHRSRGGDRGVAAGGPAGPDRQKE